MRKLILVPILAAAALAGSRQEAHAYGYGDALVACASQNTAVYKTILTDMATHCGVKLGRKAACQRIAGAPWTCNDKNGPTDIADDVCFGGQGKIFFKITAQTPMPVGWSVTGEVKAELVHMATLKTQKECSHVEKDEPPADGAGGKYASLSGRLHYYAKFTLEGSLTVTSTVPGMGPYEIAAGVSCVARTSGAVHEESETDACEAGDACSAPVPEEPAPGEPVVAPVDETHATARVAVCYVEEEPDWGEAGDGEIDMTIDVTEEDLAGDDPTGDPPGDEPIVDEPIAAEPLGPEAPL